MNSGSDFTVGPFQLIAIQWRVLVALMLRDLQSRFFGSVFGHLIIIAWPLSHILILLIINTVSGRLAPYGDSAALWFATGVVPFLAFSYIARFMMLGIVFNKPLLVFPQVKVTDILFSRAILEVLNAGLVILILFVIFLAYGIDFMPINLVQACFAIGACMLLGLGFGIIHAIIAVGFRPWITGYALLNIIMWITSGVFFAAHSLPEPLRYLESFNPIVHGIEWMRSAYYEGYGSGYLDREYMIGFALFNICLGLLLERLVRGRLLQ
jgi:capsular polysaccharide transport system permease protein